MLKLFTSLFKNKKTLCTITFTYDITPQYSVTPSVKNVKKEVIALVEDGAKESDCVSIFADNDLKNNFTYKIASVVMREIKTVTCKK